MTEEERLVSAEGKMSEAGAAAALAWIAKTWATKTCPFHPGVTNWAIDRSIAQIPGYGQNVVLAGYVFPALIVTCQTCGFMAPVNAIRAGVIEPDAPEVHDQAGEPPEPEGK